MLTEDDVVNAVCAHLTAAGYEIKRKAATTERGDDIVAVRRRSPVALYIEAKGETSNRRTSNRYGQPFSRSQCRDHVANAFYTAAKMADRKRLPKGGSVGIALADTRLHREFVNNVQQALDRLGIGVFWVDTSHRVGLTAKWKL